MSPSQSTRDVVDLIMQDHRELERLFALLRDQPETRASMAPVMATLLTAHSRAEESEVYPEARATGDPSDVEHSQREHLAADLLARRLQDTSPDSEEYDEVLSQLVDAVTHHLEEEEETVLPALRRNVDDARRAELGEAFLTARESHLGEQADDITREELAQQARNLDQAPGSRSKSELERDLAEEADT